MHTSLIHNSLMQKALRIILVLWLCATGSAAHAEARVFNLSNPNPETVLQVLQTTYGDKVRVDLIQQRLVVVGTAKQLDEIAALLAKIDRPPMPLRFTLREQPPPATEQADVVVYSSGDDGYIVDTVENALVVVEHQQIVQQPVIDGWLIAIDNKPQTVSSLTLQVQLQNSRTAQILVSFSREDNQQRRVFGSTLIGEIGAWIPLLPQPLSQVTGKNTISSGAKRGEQLYLRIERRTR
ncbi:MAG TPA: hypothetical protein VLC91_13300 [Spongiibacteraceae bacterium]|nr:hypothetical protein [Spongiibacteraceae bacterium]